MNGRVTVRHARGDDHAELTRLAALDSGSVPFGPALLAEADARVVAALPLGSGRVIADPFEPTADVVSLLELRREQIRRADAVSRPRRTLRQRLRNLGRRLSPAR